jgi:hypothetical protein
MAASLWRGVGLTNVLPGHELTPTTGIAISG